MVSRVRGDGVVLCFGAQTAFPQDDAAVLDDSWNPQYAIDPKAGARQHTSGEKQQESQQHVKLTSHKTHTRPNALNA